MAEQLFCDVVRPSIRIGGHGRHTLPLSIAVHALLVAGAIIAPLVASGALPDVRDTLAFVATAPAPLPAPPPLPQRAQSTSERPPAAGHLAAAPVVAPRAIVPETPAPLDREDLGQVEGASVGVWTGLVPGTAPPPPPPPVASADVSPVRVGGNIQMPTKIADVQPSYPPVALAARVEGVVIIEATIGPTGEVRDAKVLRGQPLLDEAALAAVRQWRYTPTRLNGVAVPVLVTVTVRFALN